ncbi:hypothetical protein [Methylobacterium oryzihabitans]|uniref:Uncharacterized protein n=1 Tax=Methylobacterium oryzihabitans TaxID=2499852 RepID=A0A3S2YKL4_9HYPH|nr:hypothetical protein [Methylobacterium oryzihabitans]RVU13188.1 hypothetical protein EOE48_26825 [Methylobacterium oryzihabitans]
MADSRTFGDLYKTKDLTEDALAAAVAAYVADLAPGPREIAPGITLDIAAAVAASAWATGVLGREEATEPHKRAAVRTAMLLAQAE